MHMGNEDEHRLSTSDSDRFLALHRLSRMRRDNSITTEVHQANHQRILQAVVKDATRQGLSNLVASDELADSIAVALQHPCLQSSFNASTWGKKLVKGRFYKVTVFCLDLFFAV
jgi:hypothetical protein